MSAPRSSKGPGVKADADLEQKLAEQAEADLLWLMADKRGRRFMWRLLELTHVYATSFRNSGEMAFLEGERNIGLRVINDIRTVCPEQNLLMEQEALALAKHNENVRRATQENYEKEQGNGNG